MNSIVAGAVSFGAGTALMQGAKAGVQGATKAGTRILSKKALQLLGKSAYRKLSKNALKKSVDDVAKKLLKTCVFACFPAGTPIRVASGTKNIEDIQVGDLVWAYNEETKEIGLKEVLNTVINETDHTISIYTEEETIETTAHHPFYTNNGWVDASELEIGDKLLTQTGRELIIKNTEFDYKLQKVYNFEVADWHTYFVGTLAWLVHNAKKCLSKGFKSLEQASKYGFDSYKKLKKTVKGLGLEVHHIIEKRLASIFKPPKKAREMMSVALTKKEHQVFTNAWRKAIPYGTDYTKLSADFVEKQAKIIYKNYPEILKAIGL